MDASGDFPVSLHPFGDLLRASGKCRAQSDTLDTLWYPQRCVQSGCVSERWRDFEPSLPPSVQRLPLGISIELISKRGPCFPIVQLRRSEGGVGRGSLIGEAGAAAELGRMMRRRMWCNSPECGLDALSTHLDIAA